MSNQIAIGLQEISSYLDDESSISVLIDATNDVDVLAALKDDKAFPNRDIEMGKISVGTADDKDIKFETETGRVNFKGAIGASAFSDLGVYSLPQTIISKLGFDDGIEPNIEIAEEEDSRFVILRWGYDIDAEANGTVALSHPVKVIFGSDFKHEALFAVIKRISNTAGSRSTLQDTVNSWRLPSQIKSIEDIKPGTWLISEVENGINLTLGGEFGYDYDWVKETELGGLIGDIGLRLQLAIETTISLNIAGKFILAVGRDSSDETDKKLKLQLFKLKKKGWNFALDSGAEIENKIEDLLPEKFDDLIKAIFGIQAAQIIDDLRKVENWTDPEQKLPDLLYGASSEYVKDLIGTVTGVDMNTAFDYAKTKLLKFLERWEDLDHELSTQIWSLLEENVEYLADVQVLLKKIIEHDQQNAKIYIENILKNIEFFKTPEGKFLISLASQDKIFNALTDNQVFQELKAKAYSASKILDGGEMQDMLVQLQNEINKRLNLDAIKEVINETDLDDLDELLKVKLKSFLGEDNLTVNKINEIQKTINLILEKRDIIYEKSLKALNRNYQFSLNSTFQKTTSGQALLDITLDFNQGEEEVLNKLLRQALKGKFDTIFTKKYEGFSLGVATLTHQIERKSSVELSLPFYNSSITHINQSLADVEAFDDDEGRILIYELDAKDTLTRRNKRMSRLSIGGHLKNKSNQVRLFSQAKLNYSYSFRQYIKDMKRADLEYQLEPYIKSYFQTLFSQQDNDHSSNPFSTWIGDLDTTIDLKEQNGTDNFGNTFFSLDINLPTRIVSAWLNAPDNENHPHYMDMSRNIQAALKRIIPFYYFANVNNFHNKKPAKVLLTYAAIPPSTDLKISYKKFKGINDDNDIYWDWVNKERQKDMILYRNTAINLSKQLFWVYRKLKATPEMSKDAEFYQQDDTISILNEMALGVKNDSIIEGNFYNLFYCEKQIIKGAHKAGLELAKFLSRANKRPTEAVKILANFGSIITDTFNNKLKQNYGKAYLGPLGTLLFFEAARAFDPELTKENIRAMLTLIILKQTASRAYLVQPSLNRFTI